MKKLMGIIILSLLTLIVGCSKPLVRTIAVLGEGKISIKPDSVVISTGVNSADPVIGKALSANNAVMESIFSGLVSLGISKDDIRTSNYNVYLYEPYKEDINPRAEYKVSNSININVNDISIIGSVLDKLVTLGANKIDGVHFTFKDNEKIQNELRKKAISNARAEAEFLAGLEGMTLVKVVSISEQDAMFTPQNKNYAISMDYPGVRGGIAAGNETISAVYTVVYQIK